MRRGEDMDKAPCPTGRIIEPRRRGPAEIRPAGIGGMIGQPGCVPAAERHQTYTSNLPGQEAAALYFDRRQVLLSGERRGRIPRK